MKKLLLIINIFIVTFSLVSFNDISVIGKEEKKDNQICDLPSENTVRFVNNYNVFVGNGFIYKSDDNYSYIISSADILDKNNISGVILKNSLYYKVSLVGKDSLNNVSVFKIDKSNESNDVCFANSNYLRRGQKKYLYGYINKEDFYIKETFLNSVGVLYNNENYYKIYKSVVDFNWFDEINGSIVFDDYNRVVGIVNGEKKDLDEGSFITTSNKLKKIADSIVKNGIYEVNRLKYNIVDYNSLSTRLKQNYEVSYKVTTGAVITSFKPLNYIFGGLNQGMTIVEVNGIKINNCYEFDNQITRYDKGSKVCLKVIKKNGKEAFYYVKL